MNIICKFSDPAQAWLIPFTWTLKKLQHLNVI